VNVSVTSGYVRRSFENVLQVDASIHRGSSGGPIIDKRGMVIGIISGVYFWGKRPEERKIGLSLLFGITGLSVLFMAYLWLVG